MIQDELKMFKTTGFFDEKAVAIQHIKDFAEISGPTFEMGKIRETRMTLDAAQKMMEG